ncbi:hypothetical protein K469DRAFT_505827, partial [Zopfia rhizophila CBS 207.26]
MGGVAIGIQANPEISALVVGAVRIAIDLALNCTTFFSRLTDMICKFEDYLGPLVEYARAADIKLVEKTAVNAYENVLDFGWKARRVFVHANGDQRRWTSLRAFMRQHWETFESEFVSIKEDMQHHLDVLLHSVQALHFDTFRKTEQERRREEERKEKSAFLSWVSSIDFEKAHQDTYAKKHEQTCDWLINEPKYRQWFRSSISSLLWCYGKPGIGKSVLASNVLENITAECGLQKDTAVCFAYYNYQHTQLGDVSQIIAALIKQLCRERDSVPPGLLKLKHDALHPSSVGTQERFLSLIEDLSEVFVVFDALDECPEQERKDIISFITNIVTTRVPCCVKVFVTSRREMDIAKAFEDKHIPTVQIRAENVTADIQTFARNQVEKLRKGEHGKTLYVTSDELKEKIVHTLARKADGMFLWVNLQLDSLCQISKSQKAQLVEDALTTLPQGLEGTYVRILERIEGQPPYMRGLALNCLAWMIYARKPLNTKELQDALATNANCRSRQDIQPDHPKVILEACGNLLEEVNSAIRPIHYTVQEFLTTPAQGLSQDSIRRWLLDSNSMHIRLSLLCLNYIHLAAFNGPARDWVDLYLRIEDYQFAGYASQNFDYHISHCDEVSHDIMQQLEDLFRQNSQRLAAILQIKALRDEFNVESVRQHFDPMSFPVSASTIIYGTRLYDLPILRQQWAGQTPPKYALHLASSAGLASAVIRLVEAGCDVNERDGRYATPLFYACSEAHLRIVQSLLKSGAEVNAQGGLYGNALQAASAGGHEQIVKLLLDTGADVNA